MNNGIEHASEPQQRAASPEDYVDPRTGKPSPGQTYAFVLDPKLSRDIVSQQAIDAVHAVERLVPEARDIAQNTRIFVRRATRFFVHNGITQILDIGSGLPSTENTHQVAQTIEPQCSIVYVDNDELTGEQANDMLERQGARNVAFIADDICHRDAILNHPSTQQLIDFTRPVGLMMASVIPFVSESECQREAGMSTPELIRSYVDAMPPGSFLAFCHPTHEGPPPERVEHLLSILYGNFRSLNEIRGYFDGTTLLPSQPNSKELADIDWSNRWHAPKPELCDPSGVWVWAGVGKKP